MNNSHARQYANRLLVHYLTVALKAGDITIHPDMRTEMNDIVPIIITAVKYELKEELIEKLQEVLK